MDVTYVRIRQVHFWRGLASLAKGLDKTTIVLCCVFGPGLLLLFVALLMLVANGLAAVTEPGSSLGQRLATVAVWQVATFSLLWGLRNVVFMSNADAFFASLPIPGRAVLQADVAIAARCYSVLWLPVIGLLGYRAVSSPPADAVLTALSISTFIGAGLVFNVLALRRRYVQAFIMGSPLVVFAVSTPLSPLAVTVEIASLALAAVVAARHEKGAPRRRRVRRRGVALYERVAISSALTIGILLHSLREAMAVRVAIVVAAFGLSTLAFGWRGTGADTAMTIMVCLCALFSTIFYRLPDTIRSTAFDRLGFLTGQSRFRTRVSTFAVLMPTTMFAIAIGLSFVFVSSMRHEVMEGTHDPWLPVCIFTGSYLLGVLGCLRWRDLFAWLVPVANIAVVLIILMSALD